jgi:hypothetical protein
VKKVIREKVPQKETLKIVPSKECPRNIFPGKGSLEKSPWKEFPPKKVPQVKCIRNHRKLILLFGWIFLGIFQ